MREERMTSSRDERSTIETQLATYLEIALIVSEEETLKYIRSRIAELEQKLRQLDQ